jgi:hypothetical protein
MPGLGGGASSANSLSSLPKPKIILDSATEPITGLVFRERLVPSTSGRVGASASNEVHLFVVSTGKVMVAHVGGKKIGNSEPKVLDDFGGSLGCVVGVKGLGEGAEEGAESGDSRAGETMAVARDEAVYMYGTEARGACFAYEGTPLLFCFPNPMTLIALSRPFPHFHLFSFPSIDQALNRPFTPRQTPLSSSPLLSSHLNPPLRRQSATLLARIQPARPRRTSRVCRSSISRTSSSLTLARSKRE